MAYDHPKTVRSCGCINGSGTGPGGVQTVDHLAFWRKLTCPRCQSTPPGCAQETLEGLGLFSRRLARKRTGPSSAEHRMENTKTNCGRLHHSKSGSVCRIWQLHKVINRWQPGCCVTLAPMSASTLDLEIRTYSRVAHHATSYPPATTVEGQSSRDDRENSHPTADSNPRRCLRPRNPEPLSLRQGSHGANGQAPTTQTALQWLHHFWTVHHSPFQLGGSGWCSWCEHDSRRSSERLVRLVLYLHRIARVCGKHCGDGVDMSYFWCADALDVHVCAKAVESACHFHSRYQLGLIPKRRAC